METIKAYLKKVRNIPLLTPAEEIELARLVKKGSQKARVQMIRSNLRLVINIAKRYTHLGLPLMDLIEEGNIGLMRAVDKFNPSRGYRFSTYAAWWIKQSIGRAISEQTKTVHVPVYMTELISKWKRIIQQLTQKLKRLPYPEEVAKRMHLPIEKVRHISKWVTKTTSLEAPVGKDGESQVIDLIEDETAELPDRKISKFLEHERVENLLELIDDREREVLDLRFGLINGVSHTLAEIAEQLDISRERVRQIEATALKKLKKFVRLQEKEKIWQETKK